MVGKIFELLVFEDSNWFSEIVFFIRKCDIFFIKVFLKIKKIILVVLLLVAFI